MKFKVGLSVGEILYQTTVTVGNGVKSQAACTKINRPVLNLCSPDGRLLAGLSHQQPQ